MKMQRNCFVCKNCSLPALTRWQILRGKARGVKQTIATISYEWSLIHREDALDDNVNGEREILHGKARDPKHTSASIFYEWSLIQREDVLDDNLK